MREALFSILSSQKDVPPLAGARVLDLYAGTGALGLEALSRGAEHATLVESGAEALAVLRGNVSSLKLEGRTRVLPMAVERCARHLNGPFDFVFADPPYAIVRDGELARTLTSMLATPVLSPTGLLILEHASSDPSPDLDGLSCMDSRRYGDTSLSFYRTNTGSSADEAAEG